MSLSPNPVEQWRHYYFIGVRKSNRGNDTLSQPQVSSILQALKAPASINCGALIAPQHLINANDMTPWVAMYNLLATRDNQLLSDTQQGKSSAHIPSAFIAQVFSKHVHWSEQELASYQLSLAHHELFFCPFLVHNALARVTAFGESIELEDQAIEILGCREFNSEQPQQLLEEMDIMVQFIKDNRPDLILH